MSIKGFVYFSLLIAGAFSGLLLMTPSMALLLVHSKTIIRWRRQYVELIGGIYFDYAAAILMTLMGVKVYLYSDTEEFLHDKGPLILCNHRTRVDWMFAGWCYAAYAHLNPDLRIVLKESLRSVPVFGWAMQLMMYIFLSRRREMDIPLIRQMLLYLLGSGSTPSIFLFPEGTDLSESNKTKSNAFARENNLPLLEYVLYPKPSGLLQCLNVFTSPHGGHCDCGMPVGYHGEPSMVDGNSRRNSVDRDSSSSSSSGGGGGRGDRSRSSSGHDVTHSSPTTTRPCHTVHDLTIAYRDHTDGVRTTDTGIAYRGQFPREVHIRIERHDLSSLPTEKRALEQWLRSSYGRKDALLKLFYEGGQLIDTTGRPTAGTVSDQAGAPSTSSSSSSSFVRSVPRYSTDHWPPRVHARFDAWKPLGIVGLWIIVVGSWLWWFSWFRWVTVCVIVTCMAARFGNGFDSIELALHGSMVIQEAAAHIEATVAKSTATATTAAMAKVAMIDRPGTVGANVMSDEGSERKDEQ